MWDLKENTSQPMKVFKPPTTDNSQVSAVISSQDGLFAVSGSEAGILVVYEVSTGAIVLWINNGPGEIHSLHFTPTYSNIRLLSFAAHDAVHLLNFSSDLDNKDIVLSGRQNFQGRVPFVAFSPDERSIASRSRDGSLNIWYIAGSLDSDMSHVSHDFRPVKCAHFSLDGRLLVAGSPDGSVTA